MALIRFRRKRQDRSPLVLGAAAGAALGAAAWYLAGRRHSLRGQVALVAGASKGLGFALAREFARQGCRIVICARHPEELERARARLAAAGADVFARTCDVTDPEQVRQLFSATRSRLGHIDILCNVAGSIEIGPIQSMGVEDFENAMRVMFWGTLYPTLEVLPEMMSRRQGRIVNITSIGGKVAVPHLLPYGCAKAAAIALSEGLRAELRGSGVRVVTIVPGLMRTGSFLNAWFKGRQEAEFAWFSMGAALPGISMSANRAARQIVAAARRGRAERILSMPAQALAMFHGLFPGLTANLLGLVNSTLLPAADGGVRDSARGIDVAQQSRSVLNRALGRVGVMEGRKLNQSHGAA